MIPDEMRNMATWLCWRLEADPKGEKPRKVPYNPRSGRRASSTDPESWGTMAEAEAAREKYGFAGIGFVFTEGCGIVGVDIDHCIDGNGALNETAAAILEKYPTYTEISPSGSGLHLFYHGKGMPGKGNKNSNTGVEMYCNGRYFTMTGKQYPGSPEEIRDGAEALPWIHGTYIAKARKKKEKKARGRAFQMSDEELMEKARGSGNGAEFSALYDGEWQGKYGSQSEADLALCCSLAFWSGKNHDQMDRLFRASKLYREKWDTVHDAAGATYGEKTLATAMEHTENTYSPGGPIGIYESGGRYIRERGEEVYPITNFTVVPIELLEFEDEAQMTCNMITMFGQTIRQVIMTSDLSSVMKFRGVLSRKTLALSFLGTENDLETLKTYLSNLEWPVKRGVRASGLYEKDGRWIYADAGGAFTAGGEAVDTIVQVEKAAVIKSSIAGSRPITAEEMRTIGPWLMQYNEPAKTVTVLAWISGCYVKEMLRQAGVKYPHLYLIGEAGSGKSTTMERIIEPLCGRTGAVAAPHVTAFTLMKEAASSNLFPQFLDEYKPSKIDRFRNAILSSHFRDSYDGHDGVRGRADQTQIIYELLAPLAVAGEEAPEEPSIRERGMELMFSKRDLKDPAAREAFAQISGKSPTLTQLGRLLLDTALTLNTETVKGWYGEALGHFNPEFPTRVINNLACCCAGLRLLETAMNRIGLSWDDVFPISMEGCAKWMQGGAFDYLLDGRTCNMTVIEQTLEIFDRMGLTDEECRFLGGDEVALYFKGFYDRFTRYIRENAIMTEYLQYHQFLKQLRKSELFVETRAVRFAGGEPKKAHILNYARVREVCDVEGFLKAPVDAAL